MGQLRTQKTWTTQRRKKETKQNTLQRYFEANNLHNFCNLRCDLFLIYTSDLFVKWKGN
jgi:uncharacterized protein YutD